MHETAISPAIRAALSDFIDYAGLFPPAELQLPEAVERYAEARAGNAAWMLGRFIVPAARASQAAAAYAAIGDRPLELSVIAATTTDARTWFGSAGESLRSIADLRDRSDVALRAVEARLPSPSCARETFDAPIGQLGALLDRAGLSGVPAYAEFPAGLPPDDDLPAAMRALRRAGLRAKLRCGGVNPGNVPTVDRVAAFMSAAAEENVSLKATAGLHHPVRHFDASLGAKTHGFLNLLAAAAFVGDVSPGVLQQIVSEEDAGAFCFSDDAFSWRDRHAGIDALREARTRFVGYGTCSFDEPVDDLTALGILPASP